MASDLGGLTDQAHLWYTDFMKSKIYFETSVVSYYAGRGSRDVVIFTKMMIRHAVENAGYECPEIVSPDAFLGDEA